MHENEKRPTLASLAIALAIGAAPAVAGAADAGVSKKAPATEQSASRQVIERGRYLVTVGNCNDCHTANFPPRDGKVPESEWLLGGGPLGLRGPWGTTYASNLRLTASRVTEVEWVKLLKTLKTRPPMPWFNLNQWKEADSKALYHYIKQLGPVGEPVKAALPPGQEPPPPFIQWPAPPK
jgi:mono/diheme cytochrome c family protein